MLPPLQQGHNPLYGPVGLNRVLSQNPANPPTPVPGKSQDSLLSSMVYHIDKLANPDVAARPGTLGGEKRMGEIFVYVARFFDNHHVALFPGVVGEAPRPMLEVIE